LGRKYESYWYCRFPVVTTISKRHLIHAFSALAVAFSAVLFAAPSARAGLRVESSSNLGIIRGVVRDEAGSPIAEATVAIFRSGTSSLLKRVTSAADGHFLAKIMPGTYTILAVAQGFNPVTLFGVEVARSADLNYGFKLERAGSGNTLPEKRTDRNSSKWRIRAAQTQRSIYQNREGNITVAEKTETGRQADAGADCGKRKGQTLVETYFAGSTHGDFAGVNFATLLPVTNKVEVVIAGQTGRGRNAPQRLETGVKFHANDTHDLRFNSSVGMLGNVTTGNRQKTLGQASFQALDEWKVREGVVLVLGVDYSRFFDAGNDSSLSPRFGLQFDLDPKTRVRTALTTQTEEKSWAHAVDLEGESFAFNEPVTVEDLYVVGSKPRMNKSRRVELGIERVIDNRSSIEANAFVDTTFGRGVGLNKIAFDPLGGDGFGEFVANQEGRAEGIRVVYTRRLNSLFSTTAGFAFGNGQRLSSAALTDPAHVFENAFFRSFYGQISADLKTGTSVQTILRLSPRATVFAIDPFKGRLAIYDPGLSILVTQSLPTLGLPIRAQAIIDARNIFDFQSGATGDEGSISLNAQRRMLRGGIQVRF
jgi:hypothetical protein